MYEKYVINFFKNMGFYNETLFKKIQNNTKLLNQDYKQIKEFIGCYPQVKDNDIIDFKLILPNLKTMKDVLVYIHEYSHVIDIEDDNEIFPNIMEAYFLKKFLKDEEYIKEEIKLVEEEILNSTSENHIVAKKVKIKILSE
jgi:hypothetical protein